MNLEYDPIHGLLLWKKSDSSGGGGTGGSTEFYKVDSYSIDTSTATATKVEYDLVQNAWAVVGTGTVTLSYTGTVAVNNVYYVLDGQIIGDPVGKWYDPNIAYGSLWVLGDSTSRMLGLDTTSTVTTLTKSGGGKSNLVSGTLGWQNQFVIDSNGDLWFCGNKNTIGFGNTNSAEYELWDDTRKWVKVKATQSRIYALTNDGYLYYSYNGSWSQCNATQVSDFCVENGGYGLVILPGGSLRSFSNSGETFSEVSGIEGASNFVKVSAINNNAIALTTDGKIYTANSIRSSSVELSLLESDQVWDKIAAGNGAFYAVNSSGELYSWCTGSDGYNKGQLGLGDTTSAPTVPTRVGTASNWTSISAGTIYLHAINALGELYSCGTGYGTGLGSNTYTSLVKVPLDGKVLDVLVNCGSNENAFGAIVQEL